MIFRIFWLISLGTLLLSCGSSKKKAETPDPTVDSSTHKFDDPNAMDEYAMGRSIYQNQCTLCHAQKVIDDYTPEEWVEILPKMIDMLNNKLKDDALTPDQVDALKFYISETHD